MSVRIHEIKLDGYKATSDEGKTLDFGTWGSYGTEKLHITAGSEWEGMVITASFTNKGETTTRLVDTDMNVDVPHEAVANTTYQGHIVFAGAKAGQMRVTADINYKVLTHSEYNNCEKKPSMTEWEQFVRDVDGSRENAAYYADQALKSANKAEDAKQEVQDLGGDQKQAIDELAASKIKAVQDESTAQQKAIENKGKTTLASIPEDYSELSKCVEQQTGYIEAITRINNQAIEWTDGKGINVDNGNYNGIVVNINLSITNELAVIAGCYVKVKAVTNSTGAVCFFNSSNKYIASFLPESTGTDYKVPDGAAYMRITCLTSKKGETEYTFHEIIDNIYEKINNQEKALSEIHDEVKLHFSTKHAMTNSNVVNKELYKSGATASSATRLSFKERIYVPAGSIINISPNGQRTTLFLWAEESGITAANCKTKDSIEAYTLYADKNYYCNVQVANLDTTAEITPDDLSASVTIECAVTNSLAKAHERISLLSSLNDTTFDEALRASLFNSSFYNEQNLFETKLPLFEGIAAQCGVSEQFLFFTDLHMFTGKEGWEKNVQKNLAIIQRVYNNSSADFVMSGGDWCSYTRDYDNAAAELSQISGIMRGLFKKGYTCVGNHDEYHTPDKKHDTYFFTEKEKANVMFCGKSPYYSFAAANSQCYVLDSGGDDSSYPDTMTEYRWRQVDWFGNALKSDDKEHSLVFMHIWSKSNTSPLTDVAALARNITDMAAAYNKHETITLNDKIYDFSNCNGKMFAIICGHTHIDFNGVNNGINIVCTRTAQNIGNGFPTFDLIAVDYTNSKLHAVRFGTGDNRTINLV